jgi:hypothetical protein
MRKRNLALFVLLGALIIQTPTAEAKTSLTLAKTMIRSLYYGQQQAAQKGIAADRNYIAAHLYPGMYLNPQECLKSWAGAGAGVPDLSTLDYDPYWKLPTGVNQNKLSGKKPKGEIFVLDVNWPAGLQTNHVAILNGKAYYFLAICGLS